MFEQNLSLLKPGGSFNVIWLSGDPVKKKKPPEKLRKKMISCDLKVIIAELRPYTLNFRNDGRFNRDFAMPLNVLHRLVYGTLKCIEVSLDEMNLRIKKLIYTEMRLLEEEKKFGITEQVSYMLLGDEDTTSEFDRSISGKKRKRGEAVFDARDIEEIYYSHINTDFSNMQIDEVSIATTTETSRYSRTSLAFDSTKEKNEREKRRREFTELFDVISEVGRTNSHLVEAAREAFSVNPLLSEVFEKKIAGNADGLEACFDLILDDKAAQTEFYLQKLKLVDQNIINDECIAEVGKRSGKALSIRADNVIPQDIYTELTSFIKGKSTLNLVPSTFQVTRDDINESRSALQTDVGQSLFVPEEPYVPYEKSLNPPIVDLEVPHEVTAREGSDNITVAQPQTENEPAVSKPVKKKKNPPSSRNRKQRRKIPSSLEVVASIKTLEEIIQFFKRRKASSSSKLAQKLRNLSEACVGFVKRLVEESGSTNVQECIESTFWFKTLDDISEEVYYANGCRMDMFEKLQQLPFVYGENNFTIEGAYDGNLKEIFRNLDEPKVDLGIYAAIVDMPIIGMSNNILNREIIYRWTNINQLELSFSQLSVHSNGNRKGYNFLPKCLPMFYMYPDFTHSLKTLCHPYDKLKYPFLKKMSQERGLYHRHSKLPNKNLRTLIQKDIGIYGHNDNVDVIEKMLKCAVSSDNVLCSKFHNLQSFESSGFLISKTVRTFAYNPNSPIVWSDLIGFLDSLFKIYCESEDNQDDKSSLTSVFLNKLFQPPPEHKPYYQERCEEVEYGSRGFLISKTVRTFAYNPNSPIVWSDLIGFLDSLFKIYCESEDNQDDKSSLTSVFLNKLFQPPPEHKPYYQERCEEVEYGSRMYEIHNALISEYRQVDNYYNNRSSEKINSKFEKLLPTILDDGTSIFEEVDMVDILDDLETFELEMSFGYIPVSIQDAEEPSERKTFDKTNTRYEVYNNNSSDLRTKSFGSSQLLVPNKWNDILTNYSSHDRKRHNNDSVPLQGQPKRQRVGISLPETPGRNLPVDGNLMEIPEIESNVVSRAPSTVGSVTFKSLYDIGNDNSSQFSNGSIVFMKISAGGIYPIPEESNGGNLGLQKESDLASLPVSEIGQQETNDGFGGQETRWLEVPLSPPQFPQEGEMHEILQETSVTMDEKRKEVEELLKRRDVVPRNQYQLPYDTKRECESPDEAYLRIARHQLGPIDSSIAEEESLSDYIPESESSDLFEHITLYNHSENTEGTYEKLKILADESRKVNFKDLVKETPTRQCVAKSFMNILLLGRGRSKIEVYQKDPQDDIKILIIDD
uniref:Rad21_Rec8_N domain-containing protein n=1 Tax=Strongyloides papillosus TaxID=174720 RepID=A0A0N5CE42_STREA